MVRCTVPVWTTILQYVITGEIISRNQVISLLMIVFGSVMVCYGDVSFFSYQITPYIRFGSHLLGYAFLLLVY